MDVVEKPKKGKKQKLKIHEIDEMNDKKSFKPLSYRHFRIIGWACLAIAQIGVILGLFAGSNNDPAYINAETALKIFSSLMAPLFLTAAFAQVLTAKNGYKKSIMIYGGGALGIFLASVLVYNHYFVELFQVITGDRTSATEFVTSFISLIGNGFVAYNIFVDLALCTLLTFFLNYHPKKFFQGKKIIIFRLMALLPLLYEAASIVLKVLASAGQITLSFYFFPLLTTKPPVAFIIFVAAAVFVKLREMKFTKNGKTIEDYEKFLDTNTNRAQFSKFLIIAIIVAVLIDIIIYVSLIVYVYNQIYVEGYDQSIFILSASETVYNWGFGGCAPMILIIPLVALFDYRKTYTNKIVDILIPIAGIALIVIIYVEGLFQFIKYKLANRGDGSSIFDDTTTEEEGGESTPSNLVMKAVKKVIEAFKE